MIVQKSRAIHDKRPNVSGIFQIRVADWTWIDELRIAHGFQYAIFDFHLSADFLRQPIRVQEITHSQSATSRLVFISRADSAQRCSYFAIAELRLGGGFDRSVI